MHGFIIYDRYVFIYSFIFLMQQHGYALHSKIMHFIRGSYLGSYHGMCARFTSHGTYSLTTWAREAHLVWDSKPVTIIIIIISMTSMPMQHSCSWHHTKNMPVFNTFEYVCVLEKEREGEDVCVGWRACTWGEQHNVL